jgi:6-phosphogluconolactonase
MTQDSHPSKTEAYYLIAGTYAPANKDGIYLFRFFPASGTAEPVNTVSGIEKPSFLTVSADGKYLYAVSETDDGQVYAYAFDRATGALQLLNTRPSGGDDPCHIIIDATGKWLFVSNYTSGSLSVFSLESDGSLGERVDHIQHEGHSIKSQQQSAHVHCAMPASNGPEVFVADLGMDRVFTYLLDPQTGRLAAGDPPGIAVEAGSGPRHLIFSGDEKFVYLIQELGGMVTVFGREAGRLTQLQSLSTLPEGYQGRIWSSDLQLSPDGRFLYAANRDDLNDIVHYEVDPATGLLTYRDRVSTGGKTARNFTLSPDGSTLLVAHRNGEEVHVFSRDFETGTLTRLATNILVPQAVCLKMCPLS